MNKLVLIFRVLIIATAGVLAFRLVFEPLQCTHAILVIERQTKDAMSAASSLQARRTASSNLEHLERISKGCSTEVDAYLLKAFNFRILDRKKEALAQVDHGLVLDSRPELRAIRAELLLELGDMDQAVAEFARITKFSTKFIQMLDRTLQSRIAAELARSDKESRP